MRLNRLLLLSLSCLALSLTVAEGKKTPKSPAKTKKYKCIEINDEDDPYQRPESYGWRKEDEELRTIGQARLGGAPPPVLASSTPPVHLPRAQLPASHFPQSTAPPLSSFISPMQPPKDANGNTLVLSPQHCAQVKHYASLYGVRDVLTWVKSNCAFAKMYLPSATCEEINVLVGSCYPDTPTPSSMPAPPVAPSQQQLLSRPAQVRMTPKGPSPAAAPPSAWNQLKSWLFY